MVRVGKTASQIISASWCLFGGGTWEDCGAGRSLDMVVLLDVGGSELRIVMVGDGSGLVAAAEVSDGVLDVLLDQVGVEGDGGRGFLTCGCDDLGARVGRVPGDPDARHAGTARRVGDHPAGVVDGAAEADQQIAVRDESRAYEDRRSADGPAALQLDAAQLVVLDEESLHGPVDDADRARRELFALVCGESAGVREEDDVRRPLADQLRMLDGVGRSAQHPDLLVAYLVAVAVRAMQDVSAPALADAWDVGQLVTKTGGHEQATRSQLPAACEQDLESRSGASRDVRDGAVDDLAAVTPHLFPSGGQEVVGRKAVAREEPVHVGGGRVAWRPAIHHGDLAPGPGQDQSRRQTGSTPADHHNVVFVHALRLPAHPGIDNDRCCCWTGAPSAAEALARPRVAAVVEAYPRCRPCNTVSKETATARVVACGCDGGAWTCGSQRC